MNLRTNMLNLVVLALVLTALAESSPQSLRLKLETARDAEEQVRIGIDLGSYYEDIHFDSAYYFFSRAYELALKEQYQNRNRDKQHLFAMLRSTALRKLTYIHNFHGYPEKTIELGLHLLELAGPIADTLSLVSAHLSMGNAYNYLGQYPQALEQYQQALGLSKAWNDPLHTAKALQNAGIIHYYTGNLKEAAAATHQALALYSELQHMLGEAGCMLTLGNIISDQEEYDRALYYYQQAYGLFEKLDHTMGKYNAILNMGAIQLSLNRNREALTDFEKALEMARGINDLQGVARCLHNMGISHSRLGNPGQALRYYQEALDVARAANMRHLEANTLSNMAGVNNDLGRHTTALSLATEGLKRSQEIQSLHDQANAYRHIAGAYEGLGDFRKALENYKLFKSLADSLHRIESRREIGRIEAMYQTEQMQKEVEMKGAQLEKQNLELAQQAEIMSRQRLLRNALLLGILSLLLLSGAIYWNYWRGKKLNNLIMAQKQEIEKINQTLLQQNIEIGRQRDEINRQKAIIEEKNTALVSSIRYAKTIQQALLPDQTTMSKCLPEHFSIYEPKEIVSGDFYWVQAQNGITLLAVADSTGHGVPGAFMSMLGISFLNEFVAHHKYLSPAQLLDEMRLYIISSLHQQGTSTDQQDGIEMGLVALDASNLTITFSGARIPLFIASEGEVLLDEKPCKTTEGAICKVKADLMPLAYHKKMKPFSSQTIQLNKGDIFYLMTDGFADQFGHKSGERFTSQRLVNLLGEIYQMPLARQKEMLLESLHKWKKDREQVDDITVIGVKV